MWFAFLVVAAERRRSLLRDLERSADAVLHDRFHSPEASGRTIALATE
jgi:hypothetical protein